jgi:penicillin-binding protein 2
MFGREDKVPQLRLTAVQYGIVGMFLLLIFGLWRLQVMSSEKYDAQAQANRIKEVPILAPRGKILDRYGRIIVDNYPSFSALLLRNEGKIKESDLDLISDGLHLDADELKQRVKRQAALPGYQPIYIKYDITPDELAFIESHRNELPMLETITVHRRLYPKNGFLAHLIGYVGEVNPEMLNTPRFELYNAGDIVGQSGVEAEYNDILMGKNGSRRVEVNSKGQEVRELSDTPATVGQDLKLTVDIDLQIAAEEALGDKDGAIVAMDPKTGEILAMASRPTFDPNDFAVRVSRKQWNSYINDPKKPLLNKAIQAQLAPGSTFKILMSVAGWQEGIAQNLHVNCAGHATFYGRSFGCWVKGGHGPVDLTKAIYQSCDVFFYTLAEKLGIGKIAEYGTKFGLGQKTGIDLPNEVSGVMPSEEWKIRNYKQKWFAGETISVGIGQGAVATTPVQLMRAIGAISMGGRMVVPHVTNPSGLPKQFVEAHDQRFGKLATVSQIDMDPNGWNMITDAMGRVLLPEGTAPSAHIPGIDIAGKTGSAQIVSLATRAKFSKNADLAQNGWFVGFTPRRNPDIVVATLFEGGEHGRLAARLATQVIKAYVDKQRLNPTQLANGTAAPEQQTPPPAPVPAKPVQQQAEKKSVEITGLWNEGNGDDDFHGGKFIVPNDKRAPRKPAKAAPGMAIVPKPVAQSKAVNQSTAGGVQ